MVLFFNFRTPHQMTPKTLERGVLLLTTIRFHINILFFSHDFYFKTRFVQALTKPSKIYARDNCTKNPRFLPTLTPTPSFI